LINFRKSLIVSTVVILLPRTSRRYSGHRRDALD
jgi:hypothetical protein